MLNRIETRGKVLLMLAGTAVLLVATETMTLPLDPIMANPRLLVGLAAIGLVSWWAYDELEEDDDFSAVASKTTDRAEDSVGGFVNGTTALLTGLVAVVMTAGQPVLDVLGGVLAHAGEMPVVVSNLVAAGLGFLGALGVLTGPQVLVVAGSLLVGALALRGSS